MNIVNLFDGYKWVYWFHIFVGAPLLMVVPIMYLKNGTVDKKILVSWYYILVAVGVAMIIYHGMKLARSLGVLKY